MRSTAAPIWTLTPEEALARVDSRREGLSEAEARERLAKFGPNKLPEKKGRSPVALFFAQFKSLLVLVLIGAAILAGVVGDLKDAIVIGVVVLLNSTLGFLQEYRAEQAVRALAGMLAQRARVRRGGRATEVDAAALVPGDVVLLEAGDRIPADGRFLELQSLEVNESALTGESLPVTKSVEAIPDVELELGDRIDIGWMNTSVTRGKAELLVTATGAETEMGRLAALLEGGKEEPTPLQVQIDHLGKRLALIAGVVVLIIAATSFARGVPLVDLLMSAVALAVAAIPEGLPAVVTVTLALGMRRMAQRNAIVKRMSAVETLGCTTDICSDKTGTLTVNQMTARAALVGGRSFSASGEGYRHGGEVRDEAGHEVAAEALEVLLEPVVLCNDSDVQEGKVAGDPTEAALLVLARKAGLDTEELRRRWPRVAEVPFDAARKWMATFHAEGDAVRVFVKGAPDVLFERCAAQLGEGVSRTAQLAEGPGCAAQFDPVAARRQNDALATQGLRVLAVATAVIPRESLRPGDEEALVGAVNGLTLIGLVGLLDPPRAEAKEAIALCKRAGISVRMITGDHVLTGAAIARELGLEGEAIAGRQLEEMDDRELIRRIPAISVFARVAPEHKLRIVRALREQRRVVAMIGDGVNDAPAIRTADIGVSMGITGTAVTKEASNMVLADDNFATIVGAVRQGRTIYDNIVKFLRFQLSTNIGALLAIFVAPFLGLPVPFNPLQILWVNLIMDGPPAMALGVDPPRPGIMNQAPRHPDARLLNWPRLANLAFYGAIMATGTLWMLGRDGGTAHARSLAFTTFVFFQFFNVFNARSEGVTALRSNAFRNRVLWISLIAVLVLQVVAIEVPWFQRILDTTSLTGAEWASCAAVAASVLVLEELRKAIWVLGRRRRTAPERRELPAT